LKPVIIGTLITITNAS